MSPVREPTRVYPVRRVLTSGGIAAPWTGMRDARETTAQQPDKVLLAQNLYLAKGEGGRAYVGRPGFAVMGDEAAADVQAIETWYRPDSTTLTLQVVGGVVQRYDWGTEAWVTALTQVQSGLATTGRVQLIPFASGLVFNDRVNVPRYWDGTDGSGVTVLTNAPVAWWGWVKSAKLVFINAANRLEIQWSEENQPNLGYAAGGYNNAWELKQLGNAPLFAGIGTNDAQVLFRERSAFSIYGEIGPDFQTASTRSNVSEVLGTNAPWSVFATDAGIVFVDADARPHVIPNGGSPAPLWYDCLEQLSPTLVPRSVTSRIWTLEDRATGELLIGLPSATSSKLTKWLAFDREKLVFEGVWLIDADVAGMILTSTGEPRWAHAEGANTYLHGAPGSGPWSDQLRAGTVAIAHAMEGPCLGRDLTEELFVDTIEVGLSASQITTLTITGETPRGVLPSLTVALEAGGGGRLGQFTLDVDRLGAISRDRRVMCGQDGLGRWVRPIVRHSQMNEPIAITDLRVVAYLDGGDPDVS